MARTIDLGKVKPSLSPTILYEGDTRNTSLNENITMNGNIDNFDFIYIKYFNPQGNNANSKLYPVSELTSNRIIDTLMNLTDNEPFSYTVYEHGIEFNSNQFKVVIRNAIKFVIKEKDMRGYTDDRDCGVKKIIGYKYL